MQVKNADDLHGGQRSSEVKWGKLCYQTWSEEQLMQVYRMTVTFMEVKGQQRSNTVNNI